MESVTVTKVPPEGNWGYMVAAANVLIFIIVLCPLQTFGIIYGDFFESLGGRTSNIAVTLGAFHLFFSITGLFVNMMFKSFSCRQICIAGATIYALANVSLIFVSTLPHILISYCAVGTAVAIMMPAIITSFNQYFIKKRLRIFLATKPLISVGSTCYPLLVHGLREFYGFHGMLAVLCAINMHGILAAILLQPVKRHLKEVTIRETSNLLQSSDKIEDSHLGDCIKLEPLLNNERRMSTITTDGNKGISDEGENTTLTSKAFAEDKTKGGLWHTVQNFFDLSLFQDLRYVNILLGIVFAEFSGNIFIPLLPIYLEKIGWSKADISFCMSGAGLADLASTTILAISAPYYRAKSRHIYLVGVFITIAGRIVLTFLESYTPVFIVLSVLWFFRTWMLSSFPMVFAEHFTPQRFPAAYGMYMFVQGITNVFMNVVAGYIRDVTGSYIIFFYFLVCCLLICAIPWTIEILWFKTKKPPLLNRNT